MSAAAKRKSAPAGKDLVYGLGSTGLSVARYLARKERVAR
jgi:UDP-N-acetylmuramoylalanine-D-glutamate ligase